MVLCPKEVHPANDILYNRKKEEATIFKQDLNQKVSRLAYLKQFKHASVQKGLPVKNSKNKH